MEGNINFYVFCFLTCYTPFTRSSKHQAIIEQTSSKCI